MTLSVILTAVKVWALRDVAVGGENQLHILDNALKQREGREETKIHIGWWGLWVCLKSKRMK